MIFTLIWCIWCFVYSNGVSLKEAYVTLQLMNDLCKDTPLPLHTKIHTSQWMSLPDSCYTVTVAMVSWWMAQICDLWLLFCAQSLCKHQQSNTVHTHTHTYIWTVHCSSELISELCQHYTKQSYNCLLSFHISSTKRATVGSDQCRFVFM